MPCRNEIMKRWMPLLHKGPSDFIFNFLIIINIFIRGVYLILELRK